MNHIILIGFKHVGKSTVGERASKELQLPFIDLDREIEKTHLQRTDNSLTCREIYASQGEKKFRDLEHETLVKILSSEKQILIALGGGTPMDPRNQELIQNHRAVLISSPQEMVYERIMLHGKPAFFSPDKNPYQTFERIWEERKNVYERIAATTIQNNGSLDEVVENLVQTIQQKI